jgi:DNA-binding winged helix-turn-helix (wHTH) protein
MSVLGQPHRADLAYVPAAATYFGRDLELQQLQTDLQHQQVVTLVGLGGIGKTRLAQEYALRTGQRTVSISLRGATSQTDLVFATAEGMGVIIRAAHDDPIASLGELMANEPALYILDNADDVSAPLQEALTIWARAAPTARFLITSRLALPGHHTIALGGIEAADAVALFVHRARRLTPDFGVAPEEFARVADAIAPLVGMPLALELAAPWLQVYSIDELAQVIRTQPIGLYGTDNPVVAALEGVWSRLSPAAQEVLLHASLFQAAFDLGALDAITPEPDVARALRQLREAGLVHERPRQDVLSARLFGLPAVVAGFCTEKWSAAARSEAQIRHADYFAPAAHRIRDIILQINTHIGSIPRRHIPELKAALTVVEPYSDRWIRLQLAMHKALIDWGPKQSLPQVLHDAIAACPPTDGWRGFLTLAASQAEFFFGRPVVALTAADDLADTSSGVLSEAARYWGAGVASLLESPDQLAARIPDLESDTLESERLYTRLLVAFNLGRLDDALQTGRRLLAHAARNRNDGVMLLGSLMMNRALSRKGQSEEALRHAQVGLEIAQKMGSDINRLHAETAVGAAHLQLGQFSVAGPFLMAAVSSARRLGLPFYVCAARCWEALRCIYTLRWADAEQHQAELSRLALRFHLAQWSTYGCLLKGVIALCRGEAVDALEILSSPDAKTFNRQGLLGQINGLQQLAHVMVKGSTSAESSDIHPAYTVLIQLALHDHQHGREALLPHLQDTPRSLDAFLRRTILRVVLRQIDLRATGPRVMQVSADGVHYVLNAQPHQLTRRPTVARVLRCLIEQRIRAPGVPILVDEIFEQVWPDEKAIARARKQRIQAAVSTLRKHGLSAVVTYHDGGYRLSVTTPIQRMPPPGAHH